MHAGVLYDDEVPQPSPSISGVKSTMESENNNQIKGYQISDSNNALEPKASVVQISAMDQFAPESPKSDRRKEQGPQSHRQLKSEEVNSETELSSRSHADSVNSTNVQPKRREVEAELPKPERKFSYNFVSDFETQKGTEIPCNEHKEKRMPRRGSFDFVVTVDPPTKLIGEFLKVQKQSGHSSFDVLDMDIEELSKPGGYTDWPFAVGENNCSQIREKPSVSESSEKRFEGCNLSKDQLALYDEEEGLRRDAVDHGICSSRVSQDPSPRLIRDQVIINNNGKQSEPSVEISPEARGQPLDEELCPDKATNFLRKRFSRSEKNPAIISDDIVKTPTIARIPSAGRKSYQPKSKSRLLDPAPSHREAMPSSPQVSGHLGGGKPPRPSSVSQKSSKLYSGSVHKSGVLGKVVEEEEDDPLKDAADLPMDYRSDKWDIWSILEWVAFIVLMATIVCSIVVPYLKRMMVWGLEVRTWAELVLVAFCGRLVSGWLVRILVFCIERSTFLLRKRVLYFVYGLREGVRNCLWLAFVLLAWRFLFDPLLERSTRRHKALAFVTKLLLCCLIAAIIWLVKVLCVKVLASSFHVSTFFDRIQESLFNQYILETLSGPPLVATDQSSNNETQDINVNVADTAAGHSDYHVLPKESGVLSKSGLIGSKLGHSTREGKSGAIKDLGMEQKDQQITIEDLQRMNRRNVSAWNMKRMMKLVRHTGVSTLTQSLDASVSESEGSDNEIQTEWQAKAAAKKIFRNVATPGSRCIGLNDLMRFLTTAEEATRAIALFDGATETGRITKHSLKNWVVKVYKERRALALSLNDTKTAVRKLHRIIDALVSMLIVVIWLLVLGIASTHLLLFVSSQLLLIVFVFGNTCKTAFEAIIFLFVIHPFDVGDRCVVDGVQMVVEEMNILTTVFLRYDNEKIYYPNSMLSTKPISNFYRSPDMGDAFDFTVDVKTSIEKIESLKEKITRYIENKPHHWYSNHIMVVREIENMNKMTMSLWLQHKMNHQDCGEKWIRRSDLVLEMRKYFQELDIEYQLLSQDVRVHTPNNMQLTTPFWR